MRPTPEPRAWPARTSSTRSLLMVETILTGLLPVAFGILLGWLTGRQGLLKHEDAHVLGTYVIRFALPFSLFEGAVKTAPEKLGNLGFALCLIFGLMGTYLIALTVGRLIFKHDLRTATMQALVCAYPDMAYFGAPILAAMFGPEGFLAVLVGNLVTSIFMLPLTIVLTHVSNKLDAGHGWKDSWHILVHSITNAVINPIVWLPILGTILSFGHVTLPAPVLSSVDLIAKAAGGTSLFAPDQHDPRSRNKRDSDSVVFEVRATAPRFLDIHPNRGLA